MQRITRDPSALTNEIWCGHAVVIFHIYSPHSEGNCFNRYAQVLHIIPLHLLLAHLPLQHPCLVTVRAVVTVLFREKELLNDEVSGERYCRDTEARERALEAVEPGEGSCVSPLLAVRW